MSTTSSSALSDLINAPKSSLQSQTSVELLRFLRLPSGRLIKRVCQTLGDKIIDYIAEENFPHRIADNASANSNTEAATSAPYIQFIFLSSLRNERSSAHWCLCNHHEANNSQEVTTNRVAITQSTLLALCNKLGVSLYFIDGVLRPSIWSKQSGGSFHTYDDEGEVEAIVGFYHYFNEWHLGPLHTWFSYNVKTKCTTYLLFDCPQSVKEKLFAGDFLPHPLAVDLLLAEECALWRESLINMHYQQIFNWHENNGTMDPPLNRHINAMNSMPILHQLSRTWNMIYEDLGDLEERLDFLLCTSSKLAAAGIPTRSVDEHLAFLRARNHLRRRWVTSFGERTKLIIGFVFSLASQEVAKQAQKENASMKTIATVTMVFLPGAFVAAVLQISDKLWQFFAITIPATILVLVVYQLWRWKQRGKGLAKGLGLVGESAAKNVPVGGA